MVLGASMLAVAGCGQNSGCVHTALELRSLPLASQNAPITLYARLTSDGDPLAAFRLSFFLTFTGPTKLVGKSGKTGDLVGYATTGDDGVANFRLPSGPAAEGLPGETAIGYMVSLTTANPINGKQYCDVHTDAQFTQ